MLYNIIEQKVVLQNFLYKIMTLNEFINRKKQNIRQGATSLTEQQ